MDTVPDSQAHEAALATSFEPGEHRKQYYAEQATTEPTNLNTHQPLLTS
ncbi:hypothetical protein [Streptomyces sp. NPDC001530]